MLLKQPLQIGALHLHNRLVLPPMATKSATEDGKVTPSILDFYADKTRGGHIGLVVTEHCYVNLQGKATPKQMSISHDSDIPGLQALADTIHSSGSKAFAQINHAGGYAIGHLTGCTNLSASSGALPGHKQIDKNAPVAMTQGDIDHVVQCFADAAARVKAAGFDGVELHSAHGYLLNQFYSPLTNKRTDRYGGDLRHRLQLHLDITAAVRKAVGPEYPIAIRLGGCDYEEGGNTIADAVEACRILEAAGVDLLDLSGGMCSYVNPCDKSFGYFRDMTSAVYAAVNIPLILTGGVHTPAQAEQLLSAKAADLIGIGRSILLDSHWAEKAMM